MRPVRQAPSEAELPHLPDTPMWVLRPTGRFGRGWRHTKTNQEADQSAEAARRGTGPRSRTHGFTPPPPGTASPRRLSPQLIKDSGIPEPRIPGVPSAGVKALRWEWLDEAGLQGEPGQVCPPPACGLVPDPVQVGADGADADVQLFGDLGVGAALGDQGD